jgi:hypothetical protein
MPEIQIVKEEHLPCLDHNMTKLKYLFKAGWAFAHVLESKNLIFTCTSLFIISTLINLMFMPQV